MGVLRRIGHVGGSEGSLSGLALRATATEPGMIEQAAPGSSPGDGCGGGTTEHLGLVEFVQGRQDGETRNQRADRRDSGSLSASGPTANGTIAGPRRVAVTSA